MSHQDVSRIHPCLCESEHVCHDGNVQSELLIDQNALPAVTGTDRIRVLHQLRRVSRGAQLVFQQVRDLTRLLFVFGFVHHCERHVVEGHTADSTPIRAAAGRRRPVHVRANSEGQETHRATTPAPRAPFVCTRCGERFFERFNFCSRCGRRQ